MRATRACAYCPLAALQRPAAARMLHPTRACHSSVHVRVRVRVRVRVWVRVRVKVKVRVRVRV